MTCIAVFFRSFIQCAQGFVWQKTGLWQETSWPSKSTSSSLSLDSTWGCYRWVVGVPVNQGRCSLLQGCHENRLRVLPHPEGEVNVFCAVWLKMNVHVCIYIICMSIYRYHYIHIHCENWGIH